MILQVDINSILKFETLDDDTQYILQKISAPEVLRKLEKKNQTKGKNSHDVTLEFLQQLDQKTFDKLVDVYKIDFEIFGYDIPQYSALFQQKINN